MRLGQEDALQEDVAGNRPAAPIDQLLRSRFAIPKTPMGAVERGRLLDLLDRGARGPLTLVSAPAGTGKTVAVAAWATSGRAPGPVVWITLGEDTDAPALWTLLTQAFRRAGLFGADDVPAPLGPSTDSFLSALASALITRPGSVVLVLDCPVDLPQDTAGRLHELVSAAAGRLRLITLTRTDPQLPLHLYRLNEAMVEIRIADLAFTADEAAQLLARRGVALPGEIVALVAARTRGWAAGLVMASMSLGRRGDLRQAVRHIDGATGPVAEYLLAEVLSLQTPAARELLLRTSVVDCLRPGLTEALAGPHASRSLAFLTRGNAFLEELPEAPGWYRYHPLFRELLAAQLLIEAPDEATRLHLIAAHWLAERALLGDAVRTALAAGAWDEAAALVIEELAVAELLPRHRAGRLRRLFRAMPPTATSQAALLVRAALAMGSRRYDTCAELLESTGRRRDGTAPPSRAESVTRAVLSVLCAAGSEEPVEGVLAAAADARALLDADERASEHGELLLLVEDAAAEALFRAGRFAEAAAACHTAIGVADGAFPVEQANCIGRLAFIAAWSGHCRRAIRLAERAKGLRLSAQLPPSTCSPLPELALAWAYTETGETDRAVRYAAAVRTADADAAASSGAGLARVADAIVRARVLRAQGDLSGAHAALRDGGRPDPDTPAWATDQIVVEDAVVDLLEGRPGRALELPHSLSDSVQDAASLIRGEAELLCLDPATAGAPAPARTGDDLTSRVRRALLDALYQARRGDDRACAEAIERALRLAAPEHLRRPFREAPEPVRRALSTRTDLTARHPWLLDREPARTRAGSTRSTGSTGPTGSVHSMGSVEDGRAVPLVEPLTDKEREVLGLLAQLLTTEETAAAMFVSVNTVRTHVRNILRKMGVAGRNQAIRRARDLGILPAA